MTIAAKLIVAYIFRSSSSRFGLTSAAMAAAIAFCIASLGGAAFGQGNTSGGFKGVVRQQGGTPLAGAKVVFRNQQFGTQATVITDEKGGYSKSSLPPGDYDIEVSANGFVTQHRTQTLYAMANYTVEPDPFEMVSTATAVIPNPTVTPNPTSPNPTTSPTPTPNTASGTAQVERSREGEGTILNPRIAGIFGTRSVVGLPLGGSTLTRTFDELAFLVPGVNPPPQAIGNSVGPGVGGGVGTSGQFSVNGLRSRANNFTVDGSDNNDEDIGVRRQGFFTLVPQPIESIQEFQIITLLAPAEFGRNLGAQVNALSKSGANRINGSLYGFYNSDKLNAKNYFDNTGGNSTTNLTARGSGNSVVPVFVNGVQKQVSYTAGAEDELSLLQFGGAVGGRVIRDKSFFFLSGESQRLDGTRERNFAVPTVGQRGFLDTGAIGLQACDGTLTNGVCRNGVGGLMPFTPGYPTSVAGDLIFSLYPFPNNPSGIYGENTYSQALSTDSRGKILSGKYDHNFRVFGQQSTFTARYNYTDDKRDLTDVGGALFSAIHPVVRTDNFSTYWSGGLTENISKEIRFSWGRTRLRFDELPDRTGFLLPASGSLITDPDERRFLLKAPALLNVTLPQNCTSTGCPAATQARYITDGTTEETSLGLVGQVIISGFSPVGVDVFNFPQRRANDTFQFADTTRWQLGTHSLAFGTDIRPVRLDSDLPRNSRPLVTFNTGAFNLYNSTTGKINTVQQLLSPQSLAAAGAAGGFFQSIASPGKDAQINLKYTQYDLFVQDDWRVSRRFNINVGLRYEYNSPPREANNKIESTFGQQFTGTGLNRLSNLADFLSNRSSIYDKDANNFAPRIGVAFAFSPNTVVRGGYGMYYDQIIGAVVSQSRNVFPTFTTANFGGGLFADNDSSFTLFNPLTAFYDIANRRLCNGADFDPSCAASSSVPLLQPGSLNTFNPAIPASQFPFILEAIWQNFPSVNGTTFGATLPAKQLNTPVSHQYSIGVEHKFNFFGQDSVLSASYVGTLGRNLLRYTTPNLGPNLISSIDSVFLNANQPTMTGNTIDPFSNAATLDRPRPRIGPVFIFETTGRSRYDSLQLNLRGRFSRSFEYQVNYVYGNAKDDVSDVFDLAGAPALPQNSLTRAGEYAPANFDVRHRFTYNFLYTAPDLKDRNGAVRAFLGGWEIAGTGKFYTGQPFTVNSVFDINFDGNLTDRLNSTQFITVSEDRAQPLILQSNANLSQMLAGFGKDGAIPRNSFRAGNVLDLDLSLSKKFFFKERQNIQIRFDFFNFINRANFGVPVRYLEAPAFGRATDTITPGSRVQIALKYNF